MEERKDAERRQCKVCRQRKPLSEFGVHNGRPRRECWPCRHIRKFRRQEQDREAKARAVIRRIIRQSRRGSLNPVWANEKAEELLRVAGSADEAARLWHEWFCEVDRKKRVSREVLGHLWALTAMLAVAEGIPANWST